MVLPRSRRIATLLLAPAVVLGVCLGSAPPASAAIPGAPTPIAVSAGNTQVSVQWGAVATATRYIVSAFMGSTPIGGCSTAPGSGATSCVVTGLTNGTTYSFYVQAQNFDGTGPQSGTVSIAPFAPTTVPGSPTGVNPTPGSSGCVNLTWTAPASNGGLTISSYTASAYTDASGGTVASSATFAGTSGVLCGLTNGAAYYVEVVATNSRGSGTPSSRAGAFPNVAPGAPVGLSVTAGDRGFSASWTAASGSSSSGFILTTWSAASGGSKINEATPLSASATVSGLTNGTTYYVDVYAYNTIGNGPASSRVAVTPRAPGGGTSPGGSTSGGGSPAGGGTGGSGPSSGGSSSNGGTGDTPNGGTNAATDAKLPTITKITPKRGPTTGGTAVTIRGTNFTGATKVTIAGKAMKNLKVISATKITVTTPTGTVGAKSIIVSAPEGNVTKKAAFTYFRR